MTGLSRASFTHRENKGSFRRQPKTLASRRVDNEVEAASLTVSDRRSRSSGAPLNWLSIGDGSPSPTTDLT